MKKKQKNPIRPVLSTVAKNLGFGYTMDEKGVQTVTIGPGNWVKEDAGKYELKIEFKPQPIGYMMSFPVYMDGILVDNVSYEEFGELANQIHVPLGELLYDQDKCYSFFTALKLIQPDVDAWRIRTFKEQSNREMEKLLAKLK